jgi:osmotically-inducible protein OsmY
MRLDSDIERDVEDQLRCDPGVDATKIGVSVRNGVVNLSGFVHSYGQRDQAERNVERVAGVVGVADDIEVRLEIIDQRPDLDLVRDAMSALKIKLPFSSENIRVVAKEGWLTLEGALTWSFARERAECAVKNIRGMKGVTNSIAEAPNVRPCEIRGKVEDALVRSTELDASRIVVDGSGSQVILRGTVRSWVQRQEAGIPSTWALLRKNGERR